MDFNMNVRGPVKKIPTLAEKLGRLSTKKAEDMGMKKCASCHAFKDIEEMKKGDKVLNSCAACRRAYMENQSKTLGVKRCFSCKQVVDYESFVNTYNDKTYANCSKCRKVWAEVNGLISNKADDEGAEDHL
jgi:flagellar biosynthesis chaperone FliJ